MNPFLITGLALAVVGGGAVIASQLKKKNWRSAFTSELPDGNAAPPLLPSGNTTNYAPSNPQTPDGQVFASKVRKGNFVYTTKERAPLNTQRLLRMPV
jgi:hypothetical protein